MPGLRVKASGSQPGQSISWTRSFNQSPYPLRRHGCWWQPSSGHGQHRAEHLIQPRETVCVLCLRFRTACSLSDRRHGTWSAEGFPDQDLPVGRCAAGNASRLAPTPIPPMGIGNLEAAVAHVDVPMVPDIRIQSPVLGGDSHTTRRLRSRSAVARRERHTRGRAIPELSQQTHTTTPYCSWSLPFGSVRRFERRAGTVQISFFRSISVQGTPRVSLIRVAVRIRNSVARAAMLCCCLSLAMKAGASA